MKRIRLTRARPLGHLLRVKELYDMRTVARIAKRSLPYLRQLAHAGKLDCYKLFGRYYMTQAQLNDLFKPIGRKK